MDGWTFYPPNNGLYGRRRTNGQAKVLVHGMELYTWLDENNKFKESGGEFKIIVYLQMKIGRWVVYKTDEVTIGEWQQFTP